MMNVPIERVELAELRIGLAAIQTGLTAKRGSRLLRQKHGRESCFSLKIISNEGRRAWLKLKTDFNFNAEYREFDWCVSIEKIMKRCPIANCN